MHQRHGFSHLIGDAVLRALGALLAASARADDLAVRYGGEEFALVLRAADPFVAIDAAERLRVAIQAHDWPSIAAGLRVTASIGVAASTEAATPDALLALADQRLYAAKRGGRNRTVAGRIVTAGTIVHYAGGRSPRGRPDGDHDRAPARTPPSNADHPFRYERD